MRLRMPKLRKYQIVLLSVSLLLVIACIVATVVCYPSLPDNIPAHYGGDGSVDRYGGKESAFLIPIINLVIFLVFVLLLFSPRVLENPNTLKPLDARFKPLVVQQSIATIVESSFLCVLFMSYIQLFILIQKPLNTVGAYIIVGVLVTDSLIRTIKLSTFTAK